MRGTVAELHARDPLSGPVTRPEVWWMRPTDAGVVVGSRQSPAMFDADRCAAAGLAIVRRRSGGGAVLVDPAQMVWIDLVLPHGVAPDDVRGAMVWAGERWSTALGGGRVHRGGMQSNAWSELVCFAGTGPGEVLIGNRKLVGLSQRRTRHGLRIQGLIHTSGSQQALAGLLAVDVPATPLPAPATWPGLDPVERGEVIAQRLAAGIGAHWG
jgi:lipoate-protein ligase A